jgi:hypothetical protein
MTDMWKRECPDYKLGDRVRIREIVYRMGRAGNTPEGTEGSIVQIIETMYRLTTKEWGVYKWVVSWDNGYRTQVTASHIEYVPQQWLPLDGGSMTHV